MGRLSLVAGAAAFFWTAAAAAAEPEGGPGRPKVLVNDGALLGVVEEGVRAFRGVPFAAPPLRQLRWAPPQPARPWPGLRDASKFGSKCLDDASEGSEDCLFLNVFAPLENETVGLDSAGLPVMLFVHGGGYEGGSSSLYDATKMVRFLTESRQPAVIVTCNYRLNVFGFLGSRELRRRDAGRGSTGNYGLQDQRAAFQWVRDNIRAFGGDPGRVMIFGQSAGAGSVSAHLAMPRSRGLFSSVAIESGSFASWSAHPMEVAEQAYEQVLNATGCATPACLEALPAAALSAAVRELPMGHCCMHLRGKPFLTWSPAIDGVELLAHPYELLKQGKIAKVPVLHGTNLDEGSMFTSEALNLTDGELRRALQQGYGAVLGAPQVSAAAALYLAEPHAELANVSGGWWAAERANGDQSFHCPAALASEHLAAAGVDVYQYYFTRPTKGLVPHGQELRYVFQGVNANGSGKTEEDVTLAEQVTSYWYRHAAFGSPNGRGGALNELPTWPKYRRGQGAYLQLDVPSAGGVRTVGKTLRRPTCTYLGEWFEKVVAGTAAVEAAGGDEVAAPIVDYV